MYARSSERKRDLGMADEEEDEEEEVLEVDEEKVSVEEADDLETSEGDGEAAKHFRKTSITVPLS